MKRSTTDGVDPKKAAGKLRHLLFGQDIGIMMATKAIYGTDDISRRTPSVASFYIEEPDCFIGQFLEGFGLINVQFPKSGCRWLTRKEVAALKKVRKVVSLSPV